MDVPSELIGKERVMALLKERIDRLILEIVHRLGAGRFFIHRTGRRYIPILAYHEIERTNFENHIRFLRSTGCCFVSMDQLGRSFQERRLLPPGAVVITFDDGWASNYTEVLPVACEQAVPITIYLVSGIYSTGIKPWFFRHAELKSSGIRDLPDADTPEILPDGRRNPVIMKSIHRYGGRITRSHTLSIDEIMEMKASGHISFGSHTMTHSDLNQLPAELAACEIAESKGVLEIILKSPVRHFAYPKGIFSADHPGMVRRAGYDTAVTVIPGWNYPETADPFSLKRITLSAADDVVLLSAKLSGFWYYLRGLRKGFV